MAFNPALHPRGPDGRFTKSVTKRLTAGDIASVRGAMGGFKPTKFADHNAAVSYLAKNKPNLPPAQAEAVDRYTGDAFLDINKALRRGDTSHPDVALLDAAMKPTTDDLVVTRTVGLEKFGGIDPTQLEKMKMTDAAYSSTSAGGQYSSLSGVTMHIAVPKGTPAVMASALSRNPHEAEVILGRGTTMAVTKVVPRQVNGVTLKGLYDMYLVVVPNSDSQIAA